MAQSLESRTVLLREISLRKEAKVKDLENMEREQTLSMLIYPLNLGEEFKEEPVSPSPGSEVENSPAAPQIIPIPKQTHPENPPAAITTELDKAPVKKLMDSGSHSTQAANEDATAQPSSLKSLRSLASQHSHMLLVRNSRKVVLTEDWKAAREERRAYLTLQRIDELKKEGLWSLHQIKKHEAPLRKKAHWDFLLEEMQWLSVDFREERKWKQALAFVVSKAIMEYHSSTDKKSLQYKFQKKNDMEVLEEDPAFTSPATSLLYYTPSSDLSHFETVYHPLELSNEEQFVHEDEHAITPVSATLFKKLRRRDDEDLDGTSSFHEPPVKRLCPVLPGTELYFPKKHPQGLFSPQENGTVAESPTPEKSSEVSKASGSSSNPIPSNLRVLIPPRVLQQGEGSENWTPDEDAELVENASDFNQNWDLIADSINTKRRHLWGTKRTPSECFLRLQKLQKDPKKFASVLQPSATARGAEDREEAKRKLVNQFSVYDHVKRIGGIKSQYAIPPPPQKKISLNAHESHSITASEAGVILNGKPMTPTELAQRIATQQMLNQQQQQMMNHQMQGNSMMGPMGQGPPQQHMPPQFGQPQFPHGGPLPPHLQQPQPPQPQPQPQPGGHMMGGAPMPMGVPHHHPSQVPIPMQMQMPQQGLQMPPNSAGHLPPSPVPMNRPLPPSQPGNNNMMGMNPAAPSSQLGPGGHLGHPQHMGGAQQQQRGITLGRGRGNFGSNTPPNGGTPGPMEMSSPILTPATVPPPAFGFSPAQPEGMTPGSPPRMYGRGRGMGMGDQNNNSYGRPPQMGGAIGPGNNMGPMSPNMGGNPNFGGGGQNGNGRPMITSGGVGGALHAGAMPPRPPHAHPGNLQNQIQQGAIPAQQHNQQIQQQLQQLKQMQQLQQMQQRQQFQQRQQPPPPFSPVGSPAQPPADYIPDMQQPQGQGPRPSTRGTQQNGVRTPVAPSPQPPSPGSPAAESPSDEAPKKTAKGSTPKTKTPAKAKPGPKSGAGTPKH